MTGARSAVVYRPPMVGCERGETASVGLPLEGNGQHLVRERISRLCFLLLWAFNTLLGLGKKPFIRENNEGPGTASSREGRGWTKAQVAGLDLNRSQDPSFSKPGGRKGGLYRWEVNF